MSRLLIVAALVMLMGCGERHRHSKWCEENGGHFILNRHGEHACLKPEAIMWPDKTLEDGDVEDI